MNMCLNLWLLCCMFALLVFDRCATAVHYPVVDHSRLAYNILHCQSESFLHRILEEVQRFPVATHVYIHTHNREKVFLSPGSQRHNITVLRHNIQNEVNQYSAKSTVPLHKLRCELLAIAPSLRVQIVSIGRSFEYSMFAADSIFIRSESVALWMKHSVASIRHNVSVDFVRVECTSTICRSIGLQTVNAPGVSRLDVGDTANIRVPSSVFSPTSSYSGVWIYPQQQFVWLVDHCTSFLRHQPGGVLSMRESMGAGGNGAFAATVYPVVDKPPSPSLHPDALVLHYGTRNWHFGTYWCELMPNLPRCLPAPEEFYMLTEAQGMKRPRSSISPSHAIAMMRDSDSDSGSVNVAESAVLHNTSMASRIVEALSPLTIKTCDIRNIRFDRRRFPRIANPSIFIGPEPRLPGLRLGYAPWIPKGGSSSARKLLYSVLSVNGSDMGSVASTLTPAMLHQMVFLSYIRSPVERALAGHHQMEMFFELGWIDVDIELFGLQWWKHHCLNSTLSQPNRKYNCDYPSTDQSDTERALLRLLAFLEEVSIVGFFDQHITPMTYLLATNPVSKSVTSRSLLFDVSSMSRVAQVLTRFTNQQWDGKRENIRAGLDKTQYPWMFRWEELVRISHGDISSTATLASRAISMICELYRDDIGCFPFEVLECN